MSTKTVLLEPSATQAAVAKGTTLAGSGSAVFFGLHANEFAAITGALIAILGFAYNIWVQERRLRIERKAAEEAARRAAEAAVEEATQ
ncbi:hypothetical protein F3N42_03715 [Marinihelvus fidelis]|uniref:Holin n=1 Tax=Marinihelvus fidelis TaxID=2613842 RepID=A0A5N0TI94_9GAMM|nr:holin [Marinihelvus fidelis]KAA9133596.1 hypothetical protein F3N42_03715 [Marinihelvus fidelis]